jgi:LysR family glycine cleavage system transcriptional activator
MTRTLPPLSSLRAFEAVARRVSFTRAAEELHVTPGAVSQQIRLLEDLLGECLFLRTKRSVALTEAATRMLPDIQAGLDALSRATSSKILGSAERTLTISVAPSFASKWLLPRLSDFSDHYPDIDLRISATVALADFRRDNIDLAIRLGRGSYPELHAEAMFAETLTPLCSPALVKTSGRLKTPDDLRKYRLLHDTSIPGESEQSSWERWLKLAGATQVSAHRGARFSLAELALQAAIEGAGVVLGRMVLAEGDLTAGRLIRPFKVVLPLEVSYFLVMAKGSSRRPEIQCFRDWLFTRLKQSAFARAPRKTPGKV